MVVIKGGTKDFDPAKGEFFSSDTKGCPNGVGGGYDTTVLAHRYTYASFDKISHPQAIGATQVSVIDDENLQGRADVLTMDVADLFITAKKFNRSNIELLMKNMFDFEGGKKILALYLAFIFRTVEEAKEFLQNNCGRMKADSWYKDPAYVARETQSIAPELSTMVDSSGKPMRDLSFDSQGWLDSDGKPTATMSPSMRRLFEIQEKMIDVFQKTGIVPPLELEVRIPGKAKVKKNGTYVDWLSHHKSAGI